MENNIQKYPECFICNGTEIPGHAPAIMCEEDYPGQNEWVCYKCRSEKILDYCYRRNLLVKKESI
jgi:hypothetical protein